MLSGALVKVGALWENDPELAEQLLGVAIQMAIVYRDCHEKQGDAINACMEFAGRLDDEFMSLAFDIVNDAADALDMLGDRVLH